MPPTLDPRHLDALHQSAIADSVIVARGYRTVTDPAELRGLGFAAAQCRVPGLLLPMWTVDGKNGLCTFRPDNPRCFEDKTKSRLPNGTYPQKVIKYEFPKGAAMRIDCPPPCQPKLADPSISLWITEGQKKGDALASLGQCTIALLGVWNWRGKNELGGNTVLADWDGVTLKGRDVRLIFDSDAQTNPHVRQALDRLAGVLTNKGAKVTVVYLPGGASGHKIGVDDWLAQGHTLVDLEALVQLPQPQAQAAPPQIELLDAAPLTLARPLALVDGRAYAATWLHVRKTITEFLDPKSGKVIKLRVPQVETAQTLFCDP